MLAPGDTIALAEGVSFLVLLGIAWVASLERRSVDWKLVAIGVNDKAMETTDVLAGLSAGDTLLLGAALGITPMR